VFVHSRQLFSDDLKRHGMGAVLCGICSPRRQDANGGLSSVDVSGMFAWKSIQTGQVLSSLEETTEPALKRT